MLVLCVFVSYRYQQIILFCLGDGNFIFWGTRKSIAER